MLPLPGAATRLGAQAALAAGPPQHLFLHGPRGRYPAEDLLSHRHLTNHYSLTDLLTAIRRANDLESNFLRIGQTLQIPVGQEPGFERVTDRMSDGAEMRGIYLTGPACGVSSVLARVDRFIAAGGNAVVFDAKDIDGGVSYLQPASSGLLGRRPHRAGHLLAGRHDGPVRPARTVRGGPDRPVPGRRTGPPAAGPGPAGFHRRRLGRTGLRLGRSRPSRRSCDYNLALAAELARAGVDEIQFDYVRFPTNGWRGRLDRATWRRRPPGGASVITGFPGRGPGHPGRLRREDLGRPVRHHGLGPAWRTWP